VKIATALNADSQRFVIVELGFQKFFQKKVKKLVNLFSHSSSLGQIKLKNFRLTTIKGTGYD